MSPFRKVPVVMITAAAPTVRPSRSLIPRIRRSLVVGRWSSATPSPSGALANDARPTTDDGSSSISPATSACLIFRFGCDSSTSRIFSRYACLSHWARGDHTAGPREVLSRRNWMPTASVTSPMMPPSASTSLTRCPLAIPPIAGLQDICAIKSVFRVNNAVFSPMRAAAIAASHPACPAPTMTTSNCSVNDCMGAARNNEHLFYQHQPYVILSAEYVHEVDVFGVEGPLRRQDTRSPQALKRGLNPEVLAARLKSGPPD